MATAKKKVSAAAKKVSDEVAAVEIEAKKTTRAAGRKAKEAAAKVVQVEEEIKKPVKRAKAAKLALVFESKMGGQITPEELAALVPKGAEAAYVKLEENKIYWVKGEETGAVDIW